MYPEFMSDTDPLTVYLTFDCDPVNFDASLEVDDSVGLQHLFESIPIVLETLESISNTLDINLEGTFFIRNISTSPAGVIYNEQWDEFKKLWKEILGRGHGLGLHPHIDLPLGEFQSENSQLFYSFMHADFNKLQAMGENSRVTRIGGHSYTSTTARILENLKVDLDSSAIPGRKLGKFDGSSDWTDYSNELLPSWTYGQDQQSARKPPNSLTQLPMTTLKSVEIENYKRYIDFSFTDFSNFHTSLMEVIKKSKHIVGISHPSTLIPDIYLEHKSLSFGRDNWTKNFLNFYQLLPPDCSFRKLSHHP
jgi:hypothetical protein